MLTAVKALWTRFWALDASLPFTGIALVVAVGWLLEGAEWASGTLFVPGPVRAIMALLCAVLLLAGLCLVGRDMARDLAGQQTDPPEETDPPRTLREMIQRPASEVLLHLTALSAALSAPVVAWWAVGDLSTAPAGVPGSYRMFTTWDLPEPLVRMVEGAAALALLGTLAVVLRAAARGTLRPRVVGLLALVCAAGLILGAAARVVTASRPDANVAGGVAVLGIVVVILPLYAWAVLQAARWCAEPPETQAEG
jgi:hypothetical protein